jgi:hypothetical protein
MQCDGGIQEFYGKKKVCVFIIVVNLIGIYWTRLGGVLVCSGELRDLYD